MKSLRSQSARPRADALLPLSFYAAMPLRISGVSVKLMHDTLTVFMQWLEQQEITRLRRVFRDEVAVVGGRVSCEQWRPDHPTGEVLPLREPWRWYHMGTMRHFCVECRKRMAHCNSTCHAQMCSRMGWDVIVLVDKLSLELRDEFIRSIWTISASRCG